LVSEQEYHETILEGTIFTYYPSRRLAAFQSGNHLDAVVFIGGLTDGILAQGYLSGLASALTKISYSLVQVILSSSYNGFGTCSLSQDAEELDVLLEHLLRKRGIKKIVLLGHSTGCQDIVTYLKQGKQAQHISKAILQAPASDREYMNMLSSTAKYLITATALVEAGKGSELMERSTYFVPITAYRYHSLAGKLTDDDMFSSDFSEDILQQLFQHIKIKTLWVYSLEDQYIPKHVNIKEHAERLQRCVPNSEVLFLPDDNHEITRHPLVFIDNVIRFLQE